MNSLIPLIPQDVLLKLGGPTIALSILSIVFKLPDKIEKLKKRISNSIGVDKDSGIPYLAPKAVRNLLNFKYERYLAALVITVAIALVFGIVYIVSFLFDQTYAPVWLATTIGVCGWIALLSVVLACFILLDMGIYVLKLGIKAYRKQTCLGIVRLWSARFRVSQSFWSLSQCPLAALKIPRCFDTC